MYLRFQNFHYFIISVAAQVMSLEEHKVGGRDVDVYILPPTVSYCFFLISLFRHSQLLKLCWKFSTLTPNVLRLFRFSPLSRLE